MKLITPPEKRTLVSYVPPARSQQCHPAAITNTLIMLELKYHICYLHILILSDSLKSQEFAACQVIAVKMYLYQGSVRTFHPMHNTQGSLAAMGLQNTHRLL